MATFTKQFTFAPGTSISSSEVNANFDRLFGALSNDVLHRDGSKAMVGMLSLPTTMPTNLNHAARKAYVDQEAQGAKNYARSIIKGGVHGGATNGVGDMVVPHSLGVTPGYVSLTPATMLGGDGNPSINHGWYPTIQNMDTQNLNVRIFSTESGLIIPNSSFIIHFIVVSP